MAHENVEADNNEDMVDAGDGDGNGNGDNAAANEGVVADDVDNTTVNQSAMTRAVPAASEADASFVQGVGRGHLRDPRQAHMRYLRPVHSRYRRPMAALEPAIGNNVRMQANARHTAGQRAVARAAQPGLRGAVRDEPPPNGPRAIDDEDPPYQILTALEKECVRKALGLVRNYNQRRWYDLYFDEYRRVVVGLCFNVINPEARFFCPGHSIELSTAKDAVSCCRICCGKVAIAGSASLARARSGTVSAGRPVFNEEAQVIGWECLHH